MADSSKVTMGKIFGGRGRGFIKPVQPAESKVGGWLSQNDNFYHKEHMGDKNRNDKIDWDNIPITECSTASWLKIIENSASTNKDDENNSDGGFSPSHCKRSKGYKERSNKDFSDKRKAKSKSTYIPEEPTNDENKLFGNCISSGKNFVKYDDIDVNVTGNNPPEPIHSFENAGLCSFLVDLIKKCKYNKLTPVQRHSIPIIMSGRDMLGCAQTGSGKTAAFLIPIINNLLQDLKEIENNGVCRPQAVVVSPTRELTLQIYNEARKFSYGSSLRVGVIYGGTSWKYQLNNLSKGYHILVATIGRLIDFVQRRRVDFSEIKYLVVDEADRMLDMEFLSKMESLMCHESMVPSTERQTLMFSATFPEEVRLMGEKFLTDYLFVAVGVVGGACTDVEQEIFQVTKFEKRNKLVELLELKGSTKTLVFVERKRSTDFLATFLCEKNFPATSIHGDREQREREEALDDFKSGKMNILVATSVAARGLDIKDVDHVINFDLPSTIDEYVHRIGRTGRVGNRGLATSFFEPVRDLSLAPSLVKILTQADQAVPSFLKEACEEVRSCGDSHRIGSRNFSGFGPPTAIGITGPFEYDDW